LEPAQRKLTTHQKAVLIQVLRTFPDERVSIRYSPLVADGQAYARDFLSVFRAIGWDVEGPEKAEASTGDASGLTVIVNQVGLPPCVEALRDALRIYGIEVETQCAISGNVGTTGFVLRVGQGS
jgi:hypothetical protein